MALPQHGSRGAIPSSPASRSLRSVFSSRSSSLHSLVTKRNALLISAFIVGTLVTVTMKREHLLWLLTTTAGAAPLLQWGQGSVFDYDGLRFDKNGVFKISVFEDLHFGERTLILPGVHSV